MPSLTAPTSSGERIVIGVDTHKELHVAVALSATGVVLDQLIVPTCSVGLGRLRLWARMLGPVTAWGVEGTGCYGAGLARVLAASGERVIEINRPDRQARRILGGKTDLIDAEAAARAVLADYATATPKSGTGAVEMIRLTRAVRSSAVKARTAAMNQLKAVVVTSPPPLRDALEGLTPARLVAHCCLLRPGRVDSVEAATRRTLRALARRWRVLDTEVREHTAELHRLTRAAAPGLLAEHGVGPDTAAALLIAAGDNPHRLRSEAAFAALCGANPIPASSGKTDRHRLNRNGDRQANAALHRIALVRMRSHPETREFIAARRTTNRANTMHLLRCLKRSLARRLYPLILQTTSDLANGQLTAAA